MKIIRRLVFVLSLPATVSVTFAYEHHDSLVDFTEYSFEWSQSLRESADSNPESQPYFLLFSAQWCHWCHEFAEHTLVRKDVAGYLNENFINIFIDVDVHNSAYTKYRATGLPYTVFLNPDRSVYYKYAGTLYGDDFLDVIKKVASEAGVGKHAIGMESTRVSYNPPKNLNLPAVEIIPDTFVQGVLENFDPLEYGLGKGAEVDTTADFFVLA